MKNEGKMTFREGLSLNFRAFKILRQKMPWLFESIFCNAVLTAIIPYIGIYFSARILNELGGQRRPEVLWKWVLLTVVVTALAGLLKAVAARWQYSRENLSYFARTDIYNDKMLRMDFCVLDEQHTHDLYSQIKQNDNWHCWGLWTMRLDFERIINAIITILSGLALSVSLFTLPVPEGSRYAFLNSPLFILAFLAIMAAVIFLAPLCSTKADGYWVKASEGAKFGNRIFGFFWYSMHTKERMLDMRMYNQQDICSQCQKHSDTFSSDGPMARYAKGRMGGLMALSAAISTVFTGFAYLFVCLKAWAGAFGVGSVTQYVGATLGLSPPWQKGFPT